MTLHLRQSYKTLVLDRMAAEVQLGHWRGYRDAGKRLLDVLLVLIAAPAVLMIVLPLVVLIARDGGAPIYRQKRLGRGGQVFHMWKLRSMVRDADAALEAHLAADPAARAEWDTKQKLQNDPRITKLGALIRKTSLDELPQLWNVLRGDMSLVGPRPMMCEQRAIYPGVAYFAMRPGITGYWQTSARNECSFAERADYDSRYFADLSLWTDLKLLTRTFRVVIRGTGV